MCAPKSFSGVFKRKHLKTKPDTVILYSVVLAHKTTIELAFSSYFSRAKNERAFLFSKLHKSKAYNTAKHQ